MSQCSTSQMLIVITQMHHPTLTAVFVFKNITKMCNRSCCHGNGEMFLYEWKEKVPLIWKDCIFQVVRMKRKQRIFLVVMVLEGSDRQNVISLNQ